MDLKKEVLQRYSKHSSSMDKHKADISVLKLINYNMLFFIPIMVFLLIAMKIGSVTTGYFEASPAIIAKIFMVPFMFVFFFLIIPFIRKREKVIGVRYSIMAFMIVGLGIAFPSVWRKDYSLLMTIVSYFGSYILVSFIMCPEVLGIERNLRDWFKHGKQISIMIICMAIVLLYVTGFGALYYDIYTDSFSQKSFAISFAEEKPPTLGTFIYYSMVTFATVGYGDISPLSTAARFVFFMESLFGIVINVLFIAILLLFVSNAEFLSQKEEETELIQEVKKEEKELMTEVKKEEAELQKEQAEIRKVETEVEAVEKEEGMIKSVFKKLKLW